MEDARPVTGAGRPVRYAAAALALAAGLIHFWVAPEHFAEAVEFGLFMVVVGVLQVAAGLLLVLRPSRRLVVATILGTLVVFVVYAVSRAVGLPFGPEPWRPEEVHTLDLVSKGTELALLVALVSFLGGRGRRAHAEAAPGAAAGGDAFRADTARLVTG